MRRPLLVVALLLILPHADARALEKRSPEKTCTLCHVTWLESVTTGEKTWLEPTETTIVVSGARSVVSTRRMCYSCHDGYVADSRKWIVEGNKHHSLRKVPKGLELPKKFRLDTNRNFYCGTCHGFHDIEAEGRIGEVPFVRLPNERSQMCLACHPDQGRQQKLKNHPLLVKPDRPPSPELAKKRAKFGPEGEVICQSCHAPHTKAVPLATTEDSELCLFCHADKKGGGSKTGRGQGLHPVNIKPDRDPQAGAGRFPAEAKPGADGKLICTTCHSTHKGLGTSLIVAKDEATFCQQCHRKQADAVAGTKHDLRKTAPKSRNRRDESPERSGTCRTCHLAHGWAREVPADADPFSGVCLSCHRAGRCAEKKQVGRFSHPVDVPMGAAESKTSLPLWPRNGESRVVCASCHDAHTYWPGLDHGPPNLDADGDPTNSFLRIEGRALCEACHAAQETLVGTKHDLRQFEKPMDEGIRHRLGLGGPCMACHRTHNAYGNMLWFKPLSEAAGDFDRDQATRRCLSCHADESMKRIEEKRGHPVGQEIGAEFMPVPADRLKTGLLVRGTGEKRSLLCTTCHLPHAGKSRDGAVSLFAGGGLPKQELCITCHGKNRWVIGSPHDFRTRKADQYKPDEGRSVQFGVCAGCHANHNSQMEKKLLWFRIPAPTGKGNPEDMLCLYCHRDPRVMEKKHVKFYAHPRGPEVRQILEGQLAEGQISPEAVVEKLRTASLFGYETMFAIRCVTCHDNHRWVATAPDEKAASFVNTEMTSFLRGSVVAERICSRCHGGEALYRYRYFHQDRIFRRRIPNE